MKGVIWEHNLGMIDINCLTKPIIDEIPNYNWLITDLEYWGECPLLKTNKNYIWLSGSDFASLLENYELSLTWAVFSAIPKNKSIDEVLKHKFPYADGYSEFWSNPITLQHPLAEMELVPWDGCLFLLISKEDSVIEKFLLSFPTSRDLEEYNARNKL